MKSCSNCKFLSRSGYMHCRRYPPVALAADRSAYPPVADAFGCGEWRRSVVETVKNVFGRKSKE